VVNDVVENSASFSVMFDGERVDIRVKHDFVVGHGEPPSLQLDSTKIKRLGR
jgi:hypothetical protein